MTPRRAQTPIHIRSDRAAARLAELTRRTGRSQAEVIEDALERVPDDDPFAHLPAEARALALKIKKLAASIPPGSFPTMKEFDVSEYDEFGDPR